jgi:hypothetical protein
MSWSNLPRTPIVEAWAAGAFFSLLLSLLCLTRTLQWFLCSANNGTTSRAIKVIKVMSIAKQSPNREKSIPLKPRNGSEKNKGGARDPIAISTAAYTAQPRSRQKFFNRRPFFCLKQDQS